MSTHEEIRRALGSYVLGALEPAERAEVNAHLSGCRSCTEEMASYAGLPALLSRVPLRHAVSPPPALPPPASLPRLLAAVEREQRARNRRLRGWQATAGALGATAALVVGVSIAPPSPEQDDVERRLVAATTTASGTVELQARPWGTSVRLRLEGLPDGESYTAYATNTAGEQTPLASWSGTSSDQVDVTGATSLLPDDVQSVSVTADGNTELLLFRG